MTDLEKLPVSDIRAVADWPKAGHGRLLLINLLGHGPIIGFRCVFEVASRKNECLLIVTGPDTGKLITDAYLGGPALDVTELFEIVAVDPLPFVPAAKKLQAGMLVRYGLDQGGYFVWTNLWKGTGEGFICIGTDGGNFEIGSYHHGLPPEHRVGISDKIDLKRREKSN
jgi:hypothetical protein